ncbi:MAG: hypothetical protein E7619_06250 [Ruminococcaceae bacterium]|nr:hypothetical protein [Oscillospiraceae bacterium]
MKRAISLILVAIMALMLVPAIGVAAAGTEKADAVVYLNGTTGVDTNDGKTAATAVASLAKAIEIANTYADAKEVVVVLSGDTMLGDAQAYVLPAHTAKITVTGNYDGTDYKSAFLTFNANIAHVLFNGPFAFEYLTISVATTNAIFAAQYNSFEIGEGVEIVPQADPAKYTSYPIILVGCSSNGGGNNPLDKAAGKSTFTNDVYVEINSGTWAYLRGGDRDSFSTYDGNMTININGGTFLQGAGTDTSYFTSANTNSPTGKAAFGDNAKIVMNLNGGEMTYLAAANYTKPDLPINADITINFNKGFKLNGGFASSMTLNTVFNGDLVVNVYGGDFSAVTSAVLKNQSTANGGVGTVTVNHNPNDPDSVAAFNILKNASAGKDDGVVYGTIADAPVVTEPVTTEAVVTTEATVDTTAAVVDTTAATGEVTPPTGDASLVIVFAAAAVLCAAAVIVIKKREN